MAALTSRPTPRRRPTAPRSGERGMALLAVVFLVLMLAGLSLGLVEEGLASRTSIRHHESNLQALEILEVGVARAVMEIRSQQDGGVDGVGNASGEIGGGTYAVTATQDLLNPDRYVLDAVGTHGLSVRRVEVGIRRRENRYWVEALFSKDALSFRGRTSTDAYDSRLGTYASQAVNSDGGGTFALLGGHIGSNGGIDLRGSSVAIRGNAIPGPLQEVQISGSPLITGDRYAREAAIDLPAIPATAFQQALLVNDNRSLLPGNGGPGGNGNGNAGGNGNGNAGGGGNGNGGGAYNPSTYALSLSSHAQLVLRSGTYFFSSINLGSQATLRIQGAVKIYCTGHVDLTAGTVLNDGRPADLQLFVAPYPLPAGNLVPQPEIRLRGGSSITAAIYAPDATLDLGGGCALFGAAVTETVRIHGNCDFHYDKALGEASTASVATMERLYWREAAPPRR